MKLKDPGTLMDQVANEDVFQGKSCYSIRVLYDESVGKDIWDFYFDKNTFALIGYRFFHDESKNDGEYITLHGEEIIGGIRMPKNRFWYYNNDHKFLGADLLLPEGTKTYSRVSLTKDDYHKAVSLQWNNLNNKKIFNISVQPHWFDNEKGLWYNYYSPKGKEYRKILFDGMVEDRLFDHEKVAQVLNEMTGDTLKPNDLPLGDLQITHQDTLTFRLNGQSYYLSLPDHKIDSLPRRRADNYFESVSPDGQWIAYAKDDNLVVKSVATGKEHPLSSDGTTHYSYGSFYGWFDIMEGENGGRPRRFNVNWSPDSKYLLTSICDTRYADKMYLLDWSVDTLYRPRLLSYYRGSPGDTTMVHNIPVVYDMSTLSKVELDFPRNTHINSIGFHWAQDADQLYARIPERGYQKDQLFRYDMKSGSAQLIIDEKSETNIDDFRIWYVETKGKILFTSDRSGWRQLYAVDIESNTTYPITEGDYFVNGISHIDEDQGWIYFLASGKEENSNPYHQLLYRVDFEGKNMTRLTDDLMHHEVSVSPDGKYFFDNRSAAGYPTKTTLRDASSGEIVHNVSKAEITMLLDEGWVPPMTFEAIGRDNSTKIYGALWLPTHFDPHKKYPVIDHSYTGPHTHMFPKSFRTSIARDNQALAELGFIVMMVDGMGSYGRSKAFHDVSYRNMGMNLKDHVLAIEQLSERYPWFDGDRVGIFGHSAGGYDAGHGMLQFPETYKVGVASSADHDFRMEKAWWPEMYMGWPVDSLYDQVSNITMADRLEGKLLLVHGGLDDNVNPSATFKLAEALVDADKEFDLLILPSQRHGYSDTQHGRYFTKKRWNYFVKHLLGVEPVWDFNWD
jgi:dipeptidyl aminopeptidase/acylaminoacyl peptidase